MKPSVSKTVHVDKRPSFAGNLVTIFAGRAERTAETTAMRQNLPGKSHVGRILLNDNTSQERLLDMRLSDIQNAQKKTATFIAHQKKTFVTRMEHRQNTWVREHSRRAGILNSMASRKRDSIIARNAESQDCDFEDVSSDGDKPEVVKGDANSNFKSGETSEKEQGRTDALPEIGSARTKSRFPRGKGNDAVTRNHTRTDLSLPSIRDSTQVDESAATGGTKLPSVLITAEVDADQNQKSTARSPRSSAERRKKKPRGLAGHEAFVLPRPSGPSPTFISEVLPRIQIRENLRMPSHLSKKASKRRRRTKSHAISGEEDPLADVRFLRLQHTLAPHLAWQESRDMASIASGVLTAKKLMSEKLRKISKKVDEDFEDG
ncbi:uncharacterized protein LOC119737994 [Patiria miniata]|uniref:Uncharacterized protein n=1 Tax=Patiria miniata TaxID=46514 RepID=A0A914AZD4_PATMI|nr:uncharacterized protein LOC119737994 [Patiria miniata]